MAAADPAAAPGPDRAGRRCPGGAAGGDRAARDCPRAARRTLGVSPKLEERLWNVTLWAIKDERSDPEWDDLVSEAVLRAYQSVRCLPEAEASTTRMAHAARWAV